MSTEGRLTVGFKIQDQKTNKTSPFSNESMLRRIILSESSTRSIRGEFLVKVALSGGGIS